MSTIRRRNLDQPDEVRRFPKMTGNLVDVGSVVIGRAVLEPGWRWSTHSQPRPVVAFDLLGNVGEIGLLAEHERVVTTILIDRPVEVFRLVD